ncbi:MAG: serine/threonine-protein kinase [Enhygromyxa sp.]
MAGHTREHEVELHEFADDRFEKTAILGEGRNARVYSAWDRELEREVAIKVAFEDTLVEDLGIEGEAAARLTEVIGELAEDNGAKANYTILREARLAARVEVPGVLAVFEVGYFKDGALAMIMPRLSSSGVSHVDPWRAIYDCVLQLGDGLAALHDVGIIHRDLKPENILYDDANRPCIADFGLACELTDEESMKHFAGSFTWMAPEVLAGGPASVQSDLFGFCMIAFWMFYGHPPFADHLAKLAGRVSEIQRADEVPQPVREALLRGLHPHKNERWSSMHELLAALREPTRVQQAKRRTPWLVAAGFSVAAAFGAGMYVMGPDEARADACEEVSRELVDFWNDDVQAELRGVLGTRKAAQRLDSFASRWVEVRARECETARRGEGPEQASPCTASVRDHFEATVTTLRTPYQRDGLAFEAVLAKLPSPEHCLEHPEDSEYGNGGLLELRRLDVEVGALLASEQLELAERRQADYMRAARELSARYDVARAIHWRAELRRLRGELDEAEEDFKRAYAKAIELRALDLSGEAMLGLVALAGGRGDLGVLDERALVAASVFGERRPDKLAELRQVQGLALVEGDLAQRERGLGLLREAVEMREAEHRRRGGPREPVGRALEALARGLLAAEQADESLPLAEQSLGIHEMEYGGQTKRAHELRRLVFVAQVLGAKFEEAHITQKMLIEPLYAVGEHDAFVNEALWTISIYEQAGAHKFAQYSLQSLLRTVQQLEAPALQAQIEDALE